MPLERYEDGHPTVDPKTGAHVLFGMLDGDVIVPCRIEFDALRHLFHAEGLPDDPLELFLAYQTDVEDAASEKYDRDGATEGTVDLDDMDFV